MPNYATMPHYASLGGKSACTSLRSQSATLGFWRLDMLRKTLNASILVLLALVLACSGGGGSKESLGRAQHALTCTSYPQWTVKTYSGGDRVQNNGSAYECKPFPYSGWCSQAAYEPGASPYWADAWTKVGDCSGSPGDGGAGGSGTSPNTACDPSVENCCPSTGFTEMVLTSGSDTFSSAQPNLCVRALDGDDTLMVGPGGYIVGGPGRDVINAWGGATVVPGPGADNVSVSGGGTVKVFDTCEVEISEWLEGGGDGTLVTPVPVEQLRSLGVVVDGFSNVVVQQNSCLSSCVTKPNCSSHGVCAEGATAGQVVCKCDPGFSGSDCSTFGLVPTDETTPGSGQTFGTTAAEFSVTDDGQT